MKLYGSTTSPFVRRLRVYLEHKSYDFINLDIFDGSDRKLLAENNPALKVPAIEDEGRCIYDSRVIFRYLTQKYSEESLSWEQENLLTLIDSVNDTLVSILLLKRTGIDTSQQGLFFDLQKERTQTVLSVLNDEVNKGAFEQWHYPTICLWCLLDWVTFRELAEWKNFTHLVQFYEKHQALEILTSTDPRH